MRFGGIDLLNIDCMEYMKTVPDKFFDLAIVACHDYKFELTACEIDKDYYEAACKRFSNHFAQTSLF